MKPFRFSSDRIELLCLVLVLLFLTASASCAETGSTSQDFSVLGERILKLLASGDARSFAGEITPTLKDYRSTRSTNAPAPKGEDPLAGFETALGHQRKKVGESAQRVLEQAARLGINSSNVHFKVKAIPPVQTVDFRDPKLHAEGEGLPWFNEAKIILVGEPISGVESDQRFRGEYELCVSGGLKFPGGWRCYEGIRWTRFPERLMDERSTAELRLMSKVAAHTGPLDATDDPALMVLGKTLIRFLQQQDETSWRRKRWIPLKWR